MALSDLLTSIRESADQEIARIQERLLAAKRDITAKADEQIKSMRSAQDMRRKERSTLLKRKVATMIERERKQALLLERRAALDRVYEEVLHALKTVPEKEVSALLDRILATAKGNVTVLPSQSHAKLIPTLSHYKKEHMHMGTPIDASGGMQFTKETYEQDFTFERLLIDNLRPATEHEVVAELFAS